MRFLIVIFLFLSLCFRAQVNFVANPSFELLYDCNPPYSVSKIKSWNSIDSTKLNSAGVYYNNCAGSVPYTGVGFQYPKSGDGFIRTLFYCTNPCAYTNSRGYPKNRLISTLIAGKTYCVKMWVNLENISPHAIDALQIYLSDVSIDTTKYINMPLIYLSPQITNTLGIVIDTLNWIEVKNTFVANGTEKYLVIGNFKTDAITSASSTTTGASGGVFSEYLIDDVSVIDFNLSVSAGPDKNIFLGDSAFIGRPPEIGLECTWSSGTVSVGSGGGLWVKPTSSGTYSYVVTQNICGNIKTDTVNVNVSPSSINENTLFSNSISIYPQPAQDIVNISLNYFYEKSIEVRVLDVNGKLVREGGLGVRSGKAEMQISDLSDGVYAIQLKNSSGQWAVKRLVIAR
jgi:hypothetical protein